MKPKYEISIEDSTDDYGFSAVSEDELKKHEKQLEQTLQNVAEHKQQVVNTYEQKLGAMYNLIMPFLLNLQKKKIQIKRNTKNHMIEKI